MPWTETTIATWSDFSALATDLTKTVATPARCEFYFRGQADSTWRLMPSLARLLEGKSVEHALEAETLAVAEFAAHAHLHLQPSILPNRPDDRLGWLTLMQHYGAPTRLLDWTASLYVATYFAVEDHWQKDGAVWVYGLKPINEKMAEKYGANMPQNVPAWNALLRDSAAPPQLITLERTDRTDRMLAQQGAFTFSRQPLYDHWQAMEDVGCDPTAHVKLLIRADAKPDFLRRLRSMNITANALFPGLDGVGRSVSELIRVTM